MSFLRQRPTSIIFILLVCMTGLFQVAPAIWHCGVVDETNNGNKTSTCCPSERTDNSGGEHSNEEHHSCPNACCDFNPNKVLAVSYSPAKFSLERSLDTLIQSPFLPISIQETKGALPFDSGPPPPVSNVALHLQLQVYLC